MFDLKKLAGGQESPLDMLMSDDDVSKGDVIYSNSGYAANDYGSVTVALLLGVSQQTLDNSAGSAGGDSLIVETSPLAFYVAGTGDTMAAAYVGYNAALASASTITSAANGSDSTGVAKIFKHVSTSKALVRLNFYSVIADT